MSIHGKSKMTRTVYITVTIGNLVFGCVSDRYRKGNDADNETLSSGAYNGCYIYLDNTTIPAGTNITMDADTQISIFETTISPGPSGYFRATKQ